MRSRLAAKVIWPVLSSQLLVTACLFDPVSILPGLEDDALEAVSTRIEPKTVEKLDLRVTGNPWGCGLLVYSALAAAPQDVLIWLHCPELGWSTRAKAKREETFAFDEKAAALTSSLSLIDNAPDEMTRALGMHLVSREEVRQAVLVAIQRGISVHNARSELRGRR